MPSNKFGSRNLKSGDSVFFFKWEGQWRLDKARHALNSPPTRKVLRPKICWSSNRVGLRSIPLQKPLTEYCAQHPGSWDQTAKWTVELHEGQCDCDHNVQEVHARSLAVIQLVLQAWGILCRVPSTKYYDSQLWIISSQRFMLRGTFKYWNPDLLSWKFAYLTGLIRLS